MATKDNKTIQDLKRRIILQPGPNLSRMAQEVASDLAWTIPTESGPYILYQRGISSRKEVQRLTRSMMKNIWPDEVR